MEFRAVQYNPVQRSAMQCSAVSQPKNLDKGVNWIKKNGSRGMINGREKREKKKEKSAVGSVMHENAREPKENEKHNTETNRQQIHKDCDAARISYNSIRENHVMNKTNRMQCLGIVGKR